MTIDGDAVVHSLRVPLPQQQAFELFVHGIHRWWPFRDHSCGGADARDVEFEAKVGGAVTEITASGIRHPWGVLTAWQPPGHFAMTWHPAQSPERATHLSVTFEVDGAGCLIVLRHTGWSALGADAAAARNDYHEGWTRVLALFAQAAASGEG